MLTALAALAVVAGCSPDLADDLTRVLDHRHPGLPRGETFELKLDVLANTATLLTVSQEHGDFSVRVADADHKSVTYDAPWGRSANEIVLLESTQPYRTTVYVSAAATNAPQAPFSLALYELRPNHRRAEKRRQGFQLFTQAARLNAARIAVIGQKAAETSSDSIIALLKKASPLFDGAGDTRHRALAQLAVAELHVGDTGRWQEAVNVATQAASGFRKSNDADSAAAARLLKASGQMELALTEEPGRAARALESVAAEMRVVAQHFKNRGKQYEQALALNYLGLLYYYRRDSANADTFYSQALDLLTEAEELGARNMVLQNLALLNIEVGDHRAAAAAYDTLLADWPADAELHGYADALHNSALAEVQLGNLEKAIERHLLSRKLLSQSLGQGGEARALHGIGLALLHIGAPERALPPLEMALTIRRELSNRQQLYSSLKAVGTAYRQMGDFERALVYHREALELTDSPMSKLMVAAEISSDLEALGQLKQARSILATALDDTSIREHPHLFLLKAQAEYLAALGATEKGNLQPLRGAVRALRSGGAPFQALQGQTWLAAAELATGNWAAARATATQALNDADVYRATLASMFLRTRLAELQRDALECLVNAMLFQARALPQHDVQRGELELRALQVVEARRQAVLNDLRTERSRRLSSPKEHSEAQLLFEQIAGKWFRAAQLLDRALPPMDEVRQLYTEVAVLQSELELLNSRRPKLVMQANAVSNRVLIDPNTDETAIVYFLGKHASWAWRLDSRGVAATSLGPREAIRRQSVKLVESIKALSPAPKWRGAAEGLSELILHPLQIAPEHASSLRVVADDVLHGVPFAVLSTQHRGAPLVEVSDLYLSPVLGALDGADRKKKPGPLRRVVVISDPTYSAIEESGSKSSNVVSARHYANSLPALPGSATEARAIQDVAGGNAVVLSSREASIAAIQKLTADELDVLHIAAHGLLIPGSQSVGLILSPLDQDGTPTPAWLRPEDALGLRSIPRLIFLSACESGVSEKISFQGALGLKEAFLAAGADNVIATHWPMADAAGRELISAFYEGLSSEGIDGRRAIRRAQMAMQRSKWNHPFYWAAVHRASF